MPSKAYLVKLIEKAREYLPSWLYKELVYYARAYAGGKARHGIDIENDVEKSQPDYADVHHDSLIGIMKPYEREEDLPGPVKRLPPKKRRQWMKAFNNAYENAPEGQDREEYAFRVAWAAIRKEGEAEYQIVKADDEKRLVYGVVYEPGVVDIQGDYTTAEEIEKAAHRFMENLQRGKAFVDINHSDQPIDAVVVESFVAPCDFVYDGSSFVVRKGSWVAVTHIRDEKVWELVKSELKGYSMAGTGRRVL